MHDHRHEPSRLPVRGTLALAGTVAGLALLLSFRGAPAPVAQITVASGDDDARATDEASGKALAGSPGAQVGTGSEVADVASPVAVNGEVPATTRPVEQALTATGDAIALRWGQVQVAVTVQGDDIIEVVTLAIPMSDRRSERINSYAEPILREEALATDSADVSVVSGATYTSEAYAASLQSALDQLGA